MEKLAGPVLFRGRLRAFGKCTNGVALSKGWPNWASVKLTLQEKQYFTPVLTCSNLVKTFTPVPTFLHLFTTVHNCSHLFTIVHTCSHLFTTVHICSHLSDYLRSSLNGSFSLNFPLAKAVVFRSYYLVEIAYFCLPN